MSILERVTVLEGEVRRMRTDVDELIVVSRGQDKKLQDVATDRARVVTGAWVANGLTVLFVGIIMWLSQRAFAAESILFKESIIKEIQAATKK